MSIYQKKFFIMTGPSGVGKDSVVDELRKTGLMINFVKTITTRPKRAGERKYQFISKRKFLKLIKEKKFIEWAKVYGYYYGTSFESLRGCLNKRGITVLQNDIQGAETIKRKFPFAKVIYIAPKNFKELRKRLETRGQDSSTTIRKRLKIAKKELKTKSLADVVVINAQNKLLEAVERAYSFIKKELKK